LDIMLVNSGHLSATGPPRESFDRGQERYWNRLYRQNKDGSFTDVTEAAGLARAGDGNYGMGVAAADYDNDGYTDLYVTSYGRTPCITTTATGPSPTSLRRRAWPRAGGPSRPAFSTTITTVSWTCSSPGTWSGA